MPDSVRRRELGEPEALMAALGRRRAYLAEACWPLKEGTVSVTVQVTVSGGRSDTTLSSLYTCARARRRAEPGEAAGA